jgi:hypothetical protein
VNRAEEREERGKRRRGREEEEEKRRKGQLHTERDGNAHLHNIIPTS